jgi:hypothetical protein
MQDKFAEERTSFRADTDVKAGLEKVVTTVLAAKGLVPSDPAKQAALLVLKRILPLPGSNLS